METFSVEIVTPIKILNQKNVKYIRCPGIDGSFGIMKKHRQGVIALDVGEIKTLTKDLDNGAKIEFSLEAKTWNEMLIGNSVGVEGGKCKYFEKNSQDEHILHFGMLCKSWDVNIEVVFDEYENYEQYNFGIKEFGGYYN